MAKIFISHSSKNNAAAKAIAEWLTENGWSDYFLDLLPDQGLAPGERWQLALQRAADRCEAVLVLISPAWQASPWCTGELLLAKSLGKTILAVLIEPIPFGQLPRELTAEWQLCDLVEGDRRRRFRVEVESLLPPTDISFAEAGLQRLSVGLQRAGLRAETFVWPPPHDPLRLPYRGLRPLEAEDAAVFF